MDPTSKTEYLVGVTIIEARDLIGKDAQGTSDPLVKVHCPNADTQITKTHYETNNPVWNQSFTFEKVLLNPLELETMELVIEVYDHNALFANELIGYTSVGLSTMYRHINHEFYRVWVPLFNKELGAKIQGKLQIS
jgi:Ca2+-dependent lipid-binding protein